MLSKNKKNRPDWLELNSVLNEQIKPVDDRFSPEVLNYLTHQVSYSPNPKPIVRYQYQ